MSSTRSTRRGFLVGAAAGLAAGVPATWYALKQNGALQPEALAAFSGATKEVPRPAAAMPGPFPGRVIEVRHPGAVRPDNTIRADAVKAMMHRGMCTLTGAPHPHDAWKRFFERGDVVGIKVNPVGRKPKANESRVARAVGSISSPEVLLEVVQGLQAAGVRPRDIIVFERYANEFREAGYENVLRERSMDGVRWYAASSGYDGSQLNIDGHDPIRSKIDRDPHVVGYDPDVFVSMGFAHPDHSRKDDRRFRSHLTVIVTRMVNKFVTIPVLKDHRSAGVTLALKNLSHGLNNNVARSHISGVRRLDEATSNPNQCNTFIPTAAGQPLIRQKATLHILDGLIGVYEGGPGCWNPTWGTWRRQSLFFATDPVALDHVGWRVIDAKRAEEGWAPVARMGLYYHQPTLALATQMAPVSARSLRDLLTLAAATRRYPGLQDTEQFDRRQPEHVILAATEGLGVFDSRAIEHRMIRLG